MRSVHAFAALLLALAAPAVSQDSGEGDFLADLERLRGQVGTFAPAQPPRPAAPAAAADHRAAVLRIETGTQCSGTLISRRGHVLTAAHCVPHLLRQARRGRVGPFEVLEHEGAAASYPAVPAGHAGGTVLTLVAAGKGASRAVSRPVMLSSLARDEAGLSRLAAVMTGDWAILKLEGYVPPACAEPTVSSPAPGAALCAVGYAGGGARGETCGSATTDFQARWFEPYKGGEEDKAATESLYRRSLAAGTITIEKTTGVAHGMSGGGLFDAQGRLAGVVTRGAIGTTGSAVGIPAVFSALRSAGLRPEDYFSCR